MTSEASHQARNLLVKRFYKQYAANIRMYSIRGSIISSLVKLLGKNSIKYWGRAFTRWMFILNSKGQLTDFCPSYWALSMMVQNELEMYSKIYKIQKDLSQYTIPKFEQTLEVFSEGHPKLDIVNPNDYIVLIRYTKGMPKFQDMKFNKIQLTRYDLDDTDILEYLFITKMRYEIMGSNNQHLSVPMKVTKTFADIELFGTPFNTCVPYCSPFADEKILGSLGSFDDFVLTESKTYLLNPPFDEDIILEAVKKVLKAISNTKDITIIAILPAWDTETQKKLGRKVYHMEFEALNVVMKSKFLKDHKVVENEKYSYFNYQTNSNVKTVDTHILIISNKDKYPSADDIAVAWL
jgi:hypothetical protein